MCLKLIDGYIAKFNSEDKKLVVNLDFLRDVLFMFSNLCFSNEKVIENLNSREFYSKLRLLLKAKRLFRKIKIEIIYIYLNTMKIVKKSGLFLSIFSRETYDEMLQFFFDEELDNQIYDMYLVIVYEKLEIGTTNNLFKTKKTKKMIEKLLSSKNDDIFKKADYLHNNFFHLVDQQQFNNEDFTEDGDDDYNDPLSNPAILLTGYDINELVPKDEFRQNNNGPKIEITQPTRNRNNMNHFNNNNDNDDDDGDVENAFGRHYFNIQEQHDIADDQNYQGISVNEPGNDGFVIDDDGEIEYIN